MSSPAPSSGAGGVRNLRAMFEKSNPTPDSPEAGSRGRSYSPVGSVRSRDSSARNTSRIRASFVSVEGVDPIARMAQMTQSTMSPTSHPGDFEPPQDIPANDAHPEGSTAAHRRGSMSLDPNRDSEVLEEVRQSVTQEVRERRASLQVDEVVPEQAVAPSTLNTPFPEIKEDEAMGSFVDNEDNKLQDSKLSNAPGPKQEATQENANNAVAEAAKNLRKVELAAHEHPRTESDTAIEDKPASMAHNAQARSEPAALIDLSEDFTDRSGAAHPTTNDDITAPKPLEAEDVQNKRQEDPTSVSEEKPEPLVEFAEVKGTPVEDNAEIAVEEAAPPAVEETAEPPAEEKVEAVPAQEASNGEAAPEHEEQPAPQEKPAESVPDSPKKSPTPVPTETPASSITSPKSTSSKTAAAPAEQPTKKTSRHSLQSTTSSATTGAKPRSSSRSAAEKKTAQTAGTAKPRPKSPTRPAKVPSRLTQPTAASAIKRDEDKKATSSTTARKPATTVPRAPAVASKTTTAAAAKKPATSRPPPASSSSTKRPESRTSRTSVGGKAPDDFLARMMRPTAASASKTHEKTDVKSPPRRNPVPKPKQANGEASKVKRKVVEGAEKAKDKAAAVVGKKEPETSAKLEPSAPIDDKAEADAPADSGAGEGSETPVPNHGEDSTSMTQTPAGLEGGVIRKKVKIINFAWAAAAAVAGSSLQLLQQQSWQQQHNVTIGRGRTHQEPSSSTIHHSIAALPRIFIVRAGVVAFNNNNNTSNQHHYRHLCNHINFSRQRWLYH
ncbi:uncharacterized protein J3D65DRAFT_663707 [Phyllosticta citribraziliensis]|uniref:Uncharacterized protein n=1 Tax=Phyllosticta citribraziliensis TaxID=989973 RepID=A0ABR1MAZ1_9PEZI